MHHCGIKDALLVFAQYALLVWMAQAPGLLVGGMLRTIVLAALALLLVFVVGRSANFLKTVATCFYALGSISLWFGVNAQWVRRSLTPLIFPDEPLEASLFQRPPPLYSL